MTKKTNSDNKTFVSFLLDETGSMNSIKDDTIGGFNNYVETLVKSGEDIRFTLVKFDSSHQTKVCVAEKIEKVVPLTKDTYRPGFSTPLIDATVKIIRATEKQVEKEAEMPKVVCVIQTDGHENASRECTIEDLKALIEAKEADDWQFVFLGAGVDAYDIGASYGFRADTTMSYGRGETVSSFAASADKVSAFAKTGNAAAMSFSSGERGASLDAFADKYGAKIAADTKARAEKAKANAKVKVEVKKTTTPTGKQKFDEDLNF